MFYLISARIPALWNFGTGANEANPLLAAIDIVKGDATAEGAAPNGTAKGAVTKIGGLYQETPAHKPPTPGTAHNAVPIEQQFRML